MTFRTSEIFSAGQIGGSGHFLDGGLEIAVIVNVADDQLGDAALFLGQIGVAHLFHQRLRQRRSGRERVEHELALFLLLGGLADRNVRLA